MNVTREEKMAEAIERMKALRVFKPTIKQFKDDGYISISEPPFGAFYWAEGDDLKRIREFEEQNNALVYLVVRSYTTFGKMDCYLYVSDYTEEWAQDRDDIKEMHRHCGYAGGGSAPDMVRGGEQHERRDDDLPEQVGTVLA